VTSPYGAFQYSNTNYFLLAYVIEGLTPRPDGSGGNYRSFIGSRILKPAGMASSGFLAGDSQLKVMADPRYLKPPIFDQPDWPKGAGEMVSTAADLRAWNTALFGGKVLGAQSLEAMLRPAAAIPAKLGGGHYAMGWIVHSRPGYTEYLHQGDIAGYTAHNVVRKAPNGDLLSISLLGSGEGLPLQKLADVIAGFAN
jgi:CubicO group peptidase (beta-lactamase class C family)